MSIPQFSRPASSSAVWASARTDGLDPADITQGFDPTGKPSGKQMNNALKRADGAARYGLQAGVPAWAADEQYFPGSVVVYQSGGAFYLYRVVYGGSPVLGTPPASDCSPTPAGLIVSGANWERIGLAATQAPGHPIFGGGYAGSAVINSSTGPWDVYGDYSDLTLSTSSAWVIPYVPIIVSGTLTLDGGPTIDGRQAPDYSATAGLTNRWLRGGSAGGTNLQSGPSYVDPVAFPYTQTATDIVVPGGDGGLGGGSAGLTNQAKWGGFAGWRLTPAGILLSPPGMWTGPIYDNSGHFYAHRVHALAGGMGGTAGCGGSSGGTNGGAGGYGGGVIAIYARNLVITNGTPIINASGAHGGSPAGNSHGEGVGGGGGGGTVVIVYQNSNLSYAALSAMFSAAICCPGGPIGTGGVTTGAAAGSVGNFALIQVPPQ